MDRGVNDCGARGGEEGLGRYIDVYVNIFGYAYR